jgi:hypothetical protein
MAEIPHSRFVYTTIVTRSEGDGRTILPPESPTGP